MSRRRSVFDHLVRNVSASVEHYVMSNAVCVYETDVRSTPTGNIDGVPRNYLELALNTADDISGGLSALASSPRVYPEKKHGCCLLMVHKQTSTMR